MKTTIKTADGESMTVQPLPISKVISINCQDKHGQMVNLLLEPGQAGVLVGAIQREFEAMGEVLP